MSELETKMDQIWKNLDEIAHRQIEAETKRNEASRELTSCSNLKIEAAKQMVDLIACQNGEFVEEFDRAWRQNDNIVKLQVKRRDVVA